MLGFFTNIVLKSVLAFDLPLAVGFEASGRIVREWLFNFSITDMPAVARQN